MLKKKNVIQLDFSDIMILFKIIEGEGCVAISESMGLPKGTISARVAKLGECGLISINPGTKKHHRNDYALTSLGKKILMTISIKYTLTDT